MLAPGRAPLAGLIEVDETEIPCRGKNDPVTGGGGRSHQGKMLIPAFARTGAVEVADGGAGPGRIRLKEVPDYSAASLHPFIADNLAPGATAKTDGWSAYPGAPSVKHDPHVVGKMAAHIVLPWVHRIFSNLKVWALGVYHGLRGSPWQTPKPQTVRLEKIRCTQGRTIWAAILPATCGSCLTPERSDRRTSRRSWRWHPGRGCRR
jgi:hypothetical protein